MLSLRALPGMELVATASALPSDFDAALGRVDNAAVYARLLGAEWRAELARRGLDADLPKQRWGIEAREWCALPGQVPQAGGVGSEALGALAARRALEAAGLARVDALVAATSTPDHVTPCFAARVARELALEPACLDVRAGGLGGLQAWAVAATLLAAGAETVLVVAAESPSRFLAAEPLKLALVYGDAAGALVLRRTASAGGLLAAEFFHRRASGRAFTVPGTLPPTVAAVERGDFLFQAADAEYGRALIEPWNELAGRLVPRCDGVDAFVPYAVTLPQLRVAGEAFGFPAERVVAELTELGCTGCAGPLVALDRWRSVRANRDRSVLLAGVAGGILAGGLAWRP